MPTNKVPFIAAVATAILVSPVVTAAHSSADDDFHENLLVSFAEYSDWPQTDRAQYMAEWRRAWSNFELGIKQRGQRFADAPRASRMDSLRALLFPESWSETPLSRCLVGGWREKLTAQNRCPTRGHPCGDPADEGFECGSVYSRACVAREPVETLTRRCSEEARDIVLNEKQYSERRHAVEDLLHDCQSKTFAPRFEDNCKLLLHDAKGIIEKFSERSQRLIEDHDKKQAGQSHARPPKYCENSRVVRIYKSMGGASDLALAATRRAIISGARVEVLGECTSACIDFPAMVPKERVCVADNAKLGFHLYTKDLTRLFVDREYTEWVFSQYHPEIRNWLKSKNLTVNELQYLKGSDLRRIYQSCEDLYAACRSANGPNWRPAKSRPQVVPEAIM